MKKIILLVLFTLVLAPNTWAKTIVLTNGDRLSGTILSEDETKVIVQTEFTGKVTIHREHIQSMHDGASVKTVDPRPLAPQPPVVKKEEPRWKSHFTLAASRTAGNTDNAKLSGTLTSEYKQDKNTYTIKLESYYAAEDKKMSERKDYGMLSFGRRLGEDKRWEFLAKFEADQDRFADIDYRLLPSLGLGYWYKEEKDFKIVGRTLIGFQYTEFRSTGDSEEEMTLISSALFEKKLWKGLAFKQEFTIYPSLEDIEDYRIKSETSLSQPITESLSWKLSLIDDYESQPSAGTKKNDYRLIAGLDYAF